MNTENGKLYDLATRENTIKELATEGKLSPKEVVVELEKMHGWPTFEIGEVIQIKGHDFKINYINTRTHEIVLASTKIKTNRPVG